MADGLTKYFSQKPNPVMLLFARLRVIYSMSSSSIILSLIVLLLLFLQVDTNDEPRDGKDGGQ